MGGVKDGDYNSPHDKEGAVRNILVLAGIASLTALAVVVGQGSQAANDSLWEASRAGDTACWRPIMLIVSSAARDHKDIRMLATGNA